jgi:NTE family protein
MTWGLVLSGGAACGLANIGVLEALEQARLRPDYVAGSSMGAIVGALYAAGHPPATLRELAAALSPATLFRLSESPFRGGLHGGLLRQRLDAHLEPLLGGARIGECEIPFVCVAGRLRAPVRWERLLAPGFVEHLRDCVESHVFGPEVGLIDAVRASSAIPVVFSPACVGGDEFVDLVHFGAIPARSLRGMYAPDVVIATDTQPHMDRMEPWLPAPLRRFMAAGREETERSVAACDLLIEPSLPASMLRFDQGTAFIEAGIEATLGRLQEIRALVESG